MSRRARESERPRRWWRSLLALITWYLIPAVLILAALGYTYVALVVHVNPPVVAVRGDAMAPTLRNGTLAVLEPVVPATLHKGDVVALRVPAPERVTYNLPADVVRRVVGIDHTSKGLVFVTKADGHTRSDVFTTPAHDVVGRLKFAVPVLGFALQFIQSIEGVIFLIAVGVIVLLYLLFSFIDRRRRLARERALVTKQPHESREQVPTDGTASSVSKPSSGALQVRVSTIVHSPVGLWPPTIFQGSAPARTHADERARASSKQKKTKREKGEKKAKRQKKEKKR